MHLEGTTAYRCERAYLTCLLVLGEKSQAIGKAVPSDFGEDRHVIIYRAIQNLKELGDPIDALTVEAELDRMQLLGRVTPAYLYGLLDDVPDCDSAWYYAKLMRAYAVIRRTEGK